MLMVFGPRFSPLLAVGPLVNGSLFWLAGETAIDVDGDGMADTGIFNSTFVDNSASQDGGGIRIEDSASSTQPQGQSGQPSGQA